MGWQHKNTLISNVAWHGNDKGILTKKYDKITLTYSQLALLHLEDMVGSYAPAVESLLAG